MSSLCYKKEAKLKKRHKIYKKKLLIHRIKILSKLSLLLGIFVFLSIFLKGLFKIKEIKIDSSIPFYKKEDYIKAGNIKPSQGILFLDTNKVKKNIEEKLPFAKVSSIKKKLPDKLILDIKKIDNFAAFKWDSKFVITDSFLKVLEIKDSVDQNINLIEGLEVLEPKPGFKIKIKDDNKRILIESLLNSLNESSLNSLVKVDTSEPENIKITYEDRIFVKFGSAKDLERKIRALAEVLKNKLKINEKGDLDFTLFSENNRLYFMPIKEDKKWVYNVGGAKSRWIKTNVTLWASS